jgi:hypothetical protein
MDISIADIEQHYRIEEDGRVFSLKRQKYLKPIRNTAGHLHVGLGYYQTGKLFLIGSLVALKYLGQRPPKSQLSYKDFNIHNLHPCADHPTVKKYGQKGLLCLITGYNTPI